MTLEIVETQRGDVVQYSITFPDGTTLTSYHRETLEWFAALVREAPYFVTGTTGN